MVRFTLIENDKIRNKKKALSHFGGLFVFKDLWKKLRIEALLNALGIVGDTGSCRASELAFLSMSQSMVEAASECELAEKTFFSGEDPSLCGRTVPQKKLNRFLNTDRFDFKKLFIGLTLNALHHRKINKKIRKRVHKNVLIVDDTPLEKSGKKMQGISKLYNASKKGFYQGYEMVSLALAAPSQAFFLNFKLKPKSLMPPTGTLAKKVNTTKLTLAAEMIAAAGNFGIAARLVTFDSWYTAVPFLKSLVSMNLTFVAPLKKNRVVIFRGKRTKLTYFLDRCKRYNEWGKIFLVELPKFGPVHLVIHKRRLNTPKATIDILITNGLNLSSERVYSIYAKRWAIETQILEAKQTFGLETFHNRNHHAIIAHLAFSLIAMLLVRAAKFFYRSLQSLTPGTIKKQLIQTLVEVEITMNQWKITFYEKNKFLYIFKQLNLAIEDV